MLGMTGFDLPEKTMRAQMASGLHIIVQLERMSDGRRRMTSIQEVVGIEGDVITMQELFRFVRTSTDGQGRVNGHYTATGIRARCAARFAAWGIQIPDDMFNPSEG